MRCSNKNRRTQGLSKSVLGMGPAASKWKETLPVGQSAFNLGESKRLSGPTSQSKHVCNRKQITGIGSQAPLGIALVREMCQEGKTLFQRGA